MVAYDGKSQQCEECKTGGREKIAKSYIVFPYTSLKRLHAQAQQQVKRTVVKKRSPQLCFCPIALQNPMQNGEQKNCNRKINRHHSAIKQNHVDDNNR